MPYRYRWCNKCFGVRTETIMTHSHVIYRNRVITTYLLATRPKGISSMQLHRDLGITQKAAWFLLQKLRESRHVLTGLDPMSCPIEADKVYRGGHKKSKHPDKGKLDKTAVVGIGDRNTIRARPVPEATKARLEHFVKSNIVKDSKYALTRTGRMVALRIARRPTAWTGNTSR